MKYSVLMKSNMKRVILLLFVLFISASSSKAQTVSCSELFNYVKTNGGYPSTYNCIGSSFLVKVERYEIEGNGVVVAWMKTSDYDFTGKPYIYCGISSTTWSYFTSAGINSWGKAFHQYIKGNNCNCN